MKHTFIIAATGRSGHHAFATWLCNQFEGKINLHNHCDQGWEQKKILARNPKTTKNFNNAGTDQGDMYCMEFLDLDDVIKYDFASFEQITSSDKVCFIIFNRDHYNWMASMLKDGALDRATEELTEHRINVWKKYVNESLGRTNIIPFNVIPVSYNSWFGSKDYRSDLINEYFADCVEFTDKGMNVVSGQGEGSSFDKMSYQNKATEMKVLERWSKYKDDKRYLNIINREDLIELSSSYFDFRPEIN